jgi:hypothetical protein
LIATAMFWIAAALVVSSQPVLTQPDAPPLAGKWQGKAVFTATGERTDGDVAFESQNGRRGTFLGQPLVDLRLSDRTLVFTWGEGDDAVHCRLPWDAEKESFRGECVTSVGESAAVLEFIPLMQDTDHADKDGPGAKDLRDVRNDSA